MRCFLRRTPQFAIRAFWTTKKFSEPGALSSPDPTNFRLPPTAYRIGLDLLASRARCKREATASRRERQDRSERRGRKLRLFLYAMACLRIASDALAAMFGGGPRPGRRRRWAAGNRKSMLRPRDSQETRAHELHAKSGKRSGMEALAGRHVVVTGGGRGIGKAIAERLAAEGASLSLLAPNLDELEEVAARGRRRRALLRHPRSRRRERGVRRGRLGSRTHSRARRQQRRRRPERRRRRRPLRGDRPDEPLRRLLVRPRGRQASRATGRRRGTSS